jgi:hypothetical protein
VSGGTQAGWSISVRRLSLEALRTEPRLIGVDKLSTEGSPHYGYDYDAYPMIDTIEAFEVLAEKLLVQRVCAAFND